VIDRRSISRAGQHGCSRGKALEDGRREQIIGFRRECHIGRLVRNHAFALAKDACETDMGLFRDVNELGAHEDQGRVPVMGGVAGEVLEHLFTAVVGLYTSAVQHERSI
jgi:hypothetical protein